MASYDFDIIVVGAGVAGGLVANALSEQNLTVGILEAGPREENRGELMQNFYTAPVKTPGSAYPNNAFAPKPSELDPHQYYVQAGSEIFNSPYERRVGGTTWHWLGTSLRLLPSDFRMNSTYGVGEDWPINYEDLEPWYAIAEKELGVAGDDRYDLGSPRAGGYPKRAITQSYLDKILAQRLHGHKYNNQPLDVRATPQARDPGRCMGSTSCMPLCPLGAKYEAIQHIRKAESNGAKVFDKAVVSHIDVNKRREVSGVRYLTWDGREHELRAKVYVIAANAIETPKILLMSTSKYAPNGVANSSDLVGRNLMDHPVKISWALSKEPIFPYRGPQSTSGIESLRDGAFRDKRGAFRVEISNKGWSWPTDAPNSDSVELIDQGLYGEALKKALKERLHRQIQIASLVEQLPDPNNRITPSEKLHDALGIPRPQIQYNLGAYEREGLKEATHAHQAIFDGLGVTESHHHDSFFGAGHIMGTYKMGSNGNNSVVNSESRSHDHQNLYLLGSGTFTTVGTANPTLTIAALTMKTAASIKSSFG